MGRFGYSSARLSQGQRDTLQGIVERRRARFEEVDFPDYPRGYRRWIEIPPVNERLDKRLEEEIREALRREGIVV